MKSWSVTFEENVYYFFAKIRPNISEEIFQAEQSLRSGDACTNLIPVIYSHRISKQNLFGA